MKFEPENASVVLSFPSALQVIVQVPILSNICRTLYDYDDDGEKYIMVYISWISMKFSMVRKLGSAKYNTGNVIHV